MKIYVIIPVHNRIKQTRKVLYCLKDQLQNNIEVIVIDDGSTDNTELILKNEFTKKAINLTVLKGDGNLWWAGSVHKGLLYCSLTAKPEDYVVFMNNDIEFESNFFSLANIIAIENHKSIFGPLVVDKNSRKIIQSGVKIVSWPLAITSRPFEGESLSNVQSRLEDHFEVDFIGGRATFIPYNIIKEIGSVEWRKLPQYHSDGEFIYRAKKHGYKIFTSTKLIVYTERASTAGVKNFEKRPKLMSLIKSFYQKGSPNNLKSRIYFAIKVVPKKWLPFFIVFDFVKTIMRFVFHFIFGNKVIYVRNIIGNNYNRLINKSK